MTGSIAVDQLMRFPGRFAEHFVAHALDQVSLSFLVDDMVVHRGGAGANIAYGMGLLGMTPTLVGAAGTDFDDYRLWLQRHGVDCASVRVSTTAHTARFVCTTDDDHNQIASFYPGAMGEARLVDLLAVADRVGVPDLVVIAPDDPAAMRRHTHVCRRNGWRFAADPSQQLVRLSGAEIRQLIIGASYLLTNDYERQLLQTRTGLSTAEILDIVDLHVVTRGADGVRILHRDGHLDVPAAVVPDPADPTGGGDAFRAGFFTALSWGLGIHQAAVAGCEVAALAVAHHGSQSYQLPDGFAEHLRRQPAPTPGTPGQADPGPNRASGS
ncbi:carbohydrate kinase family protein [Micromonospora sediminicola]|uniref:carbohydrate kinase family protein n=1 Tax=Micromonospora sediminicola TaxID=946078 RepID=UPI0033DF9ECA